MKTVALQGEDKDAETGKAEKQAKTSEYLWEKRVTEKINDICQQKIRILSNEFHK